MLEFARVSCPYAHFFQSYVCIKAQICPRLSCGLTSRQPLAARAWKKTSSLFLLLHVDFANGWICRSFPRLASSSSSSHHSKAFVPLMTHWAWLPNSNRHIASSQMRVCDAPELKHLISANNKCQCAQPPTSQESTLKLFFCHSPSDFCQKPFIFHHETPCHLPALHISAAQWHPWEKRSGLGRRENCYLWPSVSMQGICWHRRILEFGNSLLKSLSF